MKESTPRGGNALGYLASFTLGVVCLGVVVLVVRREQPPRKTNPPISDEPSPTATASKGPTQRESPSRPSATTNPANSQKAQTDAVPPEGQRVAQTSPIVVAPVVAQPIGRPVVRGQNSGEFLGAAVHTRVSGRVTLVGQAPPERNLPLDPRCAAKHQKPPTTRFYVTGKDRGLADVVVYVSEGLSAQGRPRANAPLVLNQHGCIYDKYISAAQVGQRVIVRNRDDVMHNVFLTSEKNGSFNRALMHSHDTDFTFTRPEEFIRIKCDVHPWEFAYVTVFDHPFFAITDQNGDFIIPDLPPGQYTLSAQHRKAGAQSKSITIDPHRGTTSDFEFEVRPPDTALNQ